MSAKLNEIDNRKEPVYAFRVTSVKNAWSSNTKWINFDPGKKQSIYMYFYEADS